MPLCVIHPVHSQFNLKILHRVKILHESMLAQMSKSIVNVAYDIGVHMYSFIMSNAVGMVCVLEFRFCMWFRAVRNDFCDSVK